MNRTGLFVALALAVAAGLAFGLFPQLDLAVARYFHGFVDSGVNYFAFRIYPPLMHARDVGLWIPTLLIAPASGALVLKLVFPRHKMLMSGRAIVFLIATMALAPGLLVNVVLKDHWGRPRPIDVKQFGGRYQFMAWWDPRGGCPSNCSFVSGDVAGAAWTFAPAALAPPPWRALAYGGALAFTVGMATIRMMAGGHFPSDTIFAGLFTFLIVWLLYGLIYRWKRMALSDEAIEDELARFSLGCREVLSWLGRRAANEIAGPRTNDEGDETSKRRRRGWW
jgi:lipid A 4'-phosphatase